jgi:Cdc6-like AAA superfamily ATPase
MKELNLSFTEAWVFSAVFVCNIETDSDVGINELADAFGCKKIEAVKLLPTLYVLEEKGLLMSADTTIGRRSVKQQYSSNLRFWVANPYFNLVVLGRTQEELVFPDEIQFLEYIYELGTQLKSFRISQNFLFSEIENVMETNKELSIVKEFRAIDLSKEELIVLLLAMFSHVQEKGLNLDELGLMAQRKIREKVKLKTELRNGSVRLIKEKFLRLVNEEFFDETRVLLDVKGRELLNRIEPGLGSELKPTFNGFELLKLILPEATRPVALVYGSELQLNYERLLKLCSTQTFHSIHQRLTEKGMKGGLTVLLSGPPGTGKTEMVKQLARRNGLPLVQVEMSAIKGGMVGDSEKNIRSIFQQYGQIKTSEKETPILLLNEADALLGKRNPNLGTSNQAVMQMLNTMQNILLQEMEDFDGILIATTNNEQAFDPAFSRRFLHKMTIGLPDAQTREILWQKKFPMLTSKEVQELADYAITGAEIENIAIRMMQLEILEGTEPSLSTILQLINTETSHRHGKTMGFKMSA